MTHTDASSTARATPTSPLGVWVERLLQGFEDRRAGLPGALDEAAVSTYFTAHLEEQLPRLHEQALVAGEALLPAARGALVAELERLVRHVVLPGYVRLSARFTRRERNDFYLAPEGLHGLERLAWCVAGMGVGAFVVWAPFIPLFAKEWVLPFALAGLVFPELRKWLAARRYERELNALVLAADREASRIALAHLLSSPPEPLDDVPARVPDAQAVHRSP
ncbi:MAG: hypothetical protein L0Y66_25180 [Myxococcaceae bacterium]|nr:hypothetical protein [Myxococcaceae bacterium]MCI0669429.1 hypothetical protein [Myxococcaceae bacterium]